VPPPSDAPLRVLLTNRILANRTGTELYVRDLAVGLMRHGHAPLVYSPQLGAVADEIRKQTIPVVDDLAKVAHPPDIIHGHHGLETLTALLAFPRVPAVSVCHSWIGWPDQPVQFPRIRRYLAVDDTCRDRLVTEHAVPPERVDVILNAVDLERFRPRPPLPSRPARALIFSNGSGSNTSNVAAIREACERSGIAVEIAGVQSGRVLDQPEEALGSYDLVFAKGRAALEAAAVGTAVVLCDVAGAGPMVTTGNLVSLRRRNFGIRTLRDALTTETLAREIARYDAADAAEVSRQIRALAGHDALVDHLVAVYRDVLEESAWESPDAEADLRAAAAYLRRLSPKLHERDLLRALVAKLLRVPVAGQWLRRRARNEAPTHWLQELLRTMDAD
jgi:glycosyltransferase involved in cell wall biosynthesis